MSGRPTIRTVARAAGVSTSTVSQVLRGGGRISEETRRKVLQAAKTVNYVQDRRASAMRSGQSRDIGLLINKIGNPFNAEVVGGVNESLEEHGYLVHVLDSQDDPARQERYLHTMIGGGLGGLLWVPAIGTSQDTVDWVMANSPITVTLLRQFADQVFDHVGIDSAYGTNLATKHLIELGHQRIAFLGGELDNATLDQRIGGYVTALIGAKYNNPIVRKCDETKTAAKQAAIDLHREHPDVTGFICNCDVVAAGATLGFAELGLEVGKDVSVVGFDDIEDSRLWVPPLTSVAVDPKGIGQQLAETFLARKANIDAPVRTVSLPVRLKTRASSGPPAQGGINGKSNG